MTRINKLIRVTKSMQIDEAPLWDNATGEKMCHRKVYFINLLFSLTDINFEPMGTKSFPSSKNLLRCNIKLIFCLKCCNALCSRNHNSRRPSDFDNIFEFMKVWFQTRCYFSLQSSSSIVAENHNSVQFEIVRLRPP